MNAIVAHLTPHALLLFNESFAATNEREGSEIARQIVSALLERRLKIFYVTHLYELARGFYEKRLANAMFLRAERRPDGTRTFKLFERVRYGRQAASEREERQAIASLEAIVAFCRGGDGP